MEKTDGWKQMKGLSLQLHFRSNSVKSVPAYIQDCWKKCITSDNVKMPAYEIKTFKVNGDLDFLKLHDLKHFENLLQNKYQEIRKICLNTLDTQEEPQLLTPNNGSKNTLQEIKMKYFQNRRPIVTETPKHCIIQLFENQEEFVKSMNVTFTPAVVKTSILATEKTIVSFKKTIVSFK